MNPEKTAAEATAAMETGTFFGVAYRNDSNLSVAKKVAIIKTQNLVLSKTDNMSS